MTPFYFVLAALVLMLPASADADTINGCVEQTNGKLRIVGIPGQCKATEAPISWESAGPEGPQGPQGPAGPQGEPAPVAPRFELVAFTTPTFQGDRGILTYTLACQAEFPGSRMCSMREVADTFNIPLGLAGKAWANLPDLVEPKRFACDGWRDTGPFGPAFDSAGSLFAEKCVQFLHVACCAPVP